MSLVERFLDSFDTVPRDESLSRIQMVPQGQELPRETIDRLHSDQSLTNRDQQQLRTWAEAHGYDPALLAEEKHLRLVEDCEHPNHRPISEHWRVECSDEGVTVPDTVREWQQTVSSDYRVPVQWLYNGVTYNGVTVQVQGRYGEWTVTADGSTIATAVPAAAAIQAARDYMTWHCPSEPTGRAAVGEEVASNYMENLQKVMDRYLTKEHRETDTATRAAPESVSPDWFDIFPDQIGDYDRGETVPDDGPAHLTYYRQVPDKHVPVDLVRVTCEDGVFTVREQVEVYGRLRWQDTADSVVFQRETDDAAADALVQYLLDGVDPDAYHDPDPTQVWPPEDLFTADTS